MAYAFNDDKSKAEVYSKDEIIVLRKTFNAASGASVTSFNLTDECGIDADDWDKYVVLSVMQRDSLSRVFQTAFKTSGSGSTNVYPTAALERVYNSTTRDYYASCAVSVYNYSSARDYEVMVTLMKVS